MILSSPHVHTQFCDGSSTAEEMVLSALTHGCRSLGFSSHARQNFAFQSAMSPEAETAYITEVRRLQQAYSDKIRICFFRKSIVGMGPRLMSSIQPRHSKAG